MRRTSATSNAGKLRELQAAAGPLIHLTPLPGLNTITPPEETGSHLRRECGAEGAVLLGLYGRSRPLR